MLSCLEDASAKLAKIEGEYHRFNFDEPGVTTAFMSIMHPLLVQAQIWSQIVNHIDYTKNPLNMMALGQYPYIYIPTRDELFGHLQAVNEYVVRAKAIHDRFEVDVPYTLQFRIKALVELEETMKKLPLVPSKNPKPEVLYLKSATEAKQPTVKEEKEVKKEAANEGVSFLKPGFLLKKK